MGRRGRHDRGQDRLRPLACGRDLLPPPPPPRLEDAHKGHCDSSLAAGCPGVLSVLHRAVYFPADPLGTSRNMPCTVCLDILHFSSCFWPSYSINLVSVSCTGEDADDVCKGTSIASNELKAPINASTPVTSTCTTLVTSNITVDRLYQPSFGRSSCRQAGLIGALFQVFDGTYFFLLRPYVRVAPRLWPRQFVVVRFPLVVFL